VNETPAILQQQQVQRGATWGMGGLCPLQAPRQEEFVLACMQLLGGLLCAGWCLVSNWARDTVLCCVVLATTVVEAVAAYRMQVGVDLSLKCWLVSEECEVLTECRCTDKHANILQSQCTPN
jgi:hypothetical protein